MKKENYNWWTDPKNADEVKRISWWDHEENQTFAQLPIAVVEGENHFVAACNKNTEKLLGEALHATAQGKTKEEAIKKMFWMLRSLHEYSEDCRRSYQRWVPFRKGDWSKPGRIGSMWVVIFGIQFYFRHGEGMKGGKYIPFTKLNISISNEWSQYKKYKQEQKEKRKNETNI